MTATTQPKMTKAEAVFCIALTVPIAVLRGWVLAVLGGWFLVPLGVPRFGTFVGAGLLVIAGLAKGYTDDEPKDLEGNVRGLMTMAVMALLGLGFGFIWHLAAG